MFQIDFKMFLKDVDLWSIVDRLTFRRPYGFRRNENGWVLVVKGIFARHLGLYLVAVISEVAGATTRSFRLNTGWENPCIYLLIAALGGEIKFPRPIGHSSGLRCSDAGFDLRSQNARFLRV